MDDLTSPPSLLIGWQSVKSLRMIDGVTGNKRLPANIRQDIIERTDGIPLFVEEMTKAVLEAESEGAAEQTSCRCPVPCIGGPGKPARLPNGAA